MTVITTLRKNEEIYVEWSIEKFFDLPKDVDYFVESEPFLISDGKWCLRIYPNGRKDAEAAGHIDLNIRRLDSGDKITVEFETGFKKNEGPRVEASKYDPKSKDDTVLYEWYNFGPSEYMSRFKYSLGKDGAVTVFCIARVGDSIEVPPKTAPVDGKETLFEKYRNMLYNHDFSDVTVTSEGSSRKVHKSILAARSYVFYNMFSSNKERDYIELCDCNRDEFEDFLAFIYIGDSSVVKDYNAMSLYKAAKRYEIQDLNDRCIQCMAEQPLSSDTFCDFFLSAAIQGNSDKMDAATDFFFDNAKDIVSSSKWEKFTADHFSHSRDLLYKFAEKRGRQITDE